MSFDTRERSQYAGEPVECYRFSRPGELWMLTSADRPITLPSGTYVPAPVTRGAIKQSQEDQTGTLEITLPQEHELSQLFLAETPTERTAVIVYAAHRGDESDPAAIFVGNVASARFEPPSATLVCVPIMAAFRRTVPLLRFQRTCNWPLYGPGCGVDAAAFRDAATVSAVSGADIVAAAFALRPDGWYTNGWIENDAGERRFIVGHVGNTVTLMVPFRSLTPGTVLHAFAGCDRTEATCASKFDNLVNHFGFARIPTRNPHTGAIV